MFYLCNVEVLLHWWSRASARVERLTVSCCGSQQEPTQDLHIQVRMINVRKLAGL